MSNNDQVKLTMSCVKCKKEMQYNVPRLGPGGGYVHSDTGQFLCESVQSSPAAPVKAATVGRERPILTRCPSCHNTNTIFVSDNGCLVCGWLDCKDPTLLDRMANCPTVSGEPVKASTDGELEKRIAFRLNLISTDFNPANDKQIGLALNEMRHAVAALAEDVLNGKLRAPAEMVSPFVDCKCWVPSLECVGDWKRYGVNGAIHLLHDDAMHCEVCGHGRVEKGGGSNG